MNTSEYLSNDQKIPVHQWTNGSEHVLIVRCVGQDGKTYGGFQNPLEVGATLIVPDQWEPIWGPQPDTWRPGWIPDHRCGGGIHGWAWGIAIGDGKDPNWTGIWQVYECKPDDVIGDVKGAKVKFRTGILRYSGDWQGVNHYVLAGQMAWVFHNASGSASNSGASGSASNSGYSGSAKSSMPATAAISTELNSRVMAGPYSAIALSWWNAEANRAEMRAAEIGCGDGSDHKLKANIWYVVNNTGEIIEASDGSI